MGNISGFETNPTLLLRLRRSPADPEAWQQFVERYGELIFGWCCRWGLQVADAEDVTQTILLKMMRALPSFDYDSGQSFRGWLKTLTHHAWYDLITVRRAVATGGGELDGALGTVPARDDLISQMESAYDRELAEAALDRVRIRVHPATWEAFSLTALNNVTAAKAAEQLGLSVVSVYKARSNVLKLLQQEINYMSGGDNER
jgi:RNA polymerase sigma-70 factor (ECF subfamily)